MMHSYELQDLLNDMMNSPKRRSGNVYFKDKEGNMYEVDFVEIDIDNDLILSKNMEED